MKEPLALLINDIHISKDNISEVRKNWDEMLMIADEKNIECIVIGGDLWQSRSSQSLNTLLSVKSALEQAVAHDKLLTIAEGNHCKTDLEDLVGYSHIFDGLSPEITIVGDHQIMYWDKCDFVLIVMSYFPENGTFLDRLEIAVKDAFNQYPEVVKSKSDIILYLHEGIQGALGDFEVPGELPLEPFLDFKKVLAGHYHDHCKIKNSPVEYIGASRQHNFGEDEEKGYTILFDDGTTEFVKNQVNTRYKTIELTPNQLKDFTLVKEPLYKYRLKVICDETESRLFDRQQYLDMGFDKVEIKELAIRPKKEIASAITEKYDKKGIQREYKTYCQEKEIDNKLGLKYLG